MTEPVMVGGAPAATSNKRVLILLGVAAVIAVVALLLPKLLFAGGDEAVDDFAVLPAGVAAPADGPAGGAADEVEALAEPARTFEVFSTKNPFTPLIDMTPVAAVTPVPVDGSIVAPVGVAPAPVAPGTVVAPVGVAPPPSTGASGSVATEPGSGQRVALLEVFVDAEGVTVASVRVNDTVYEVAEGAAFATSYEVVTLSVADGCGQFLYGDDRFRLCEGEELLK